MSSTTYSSKRHVPQTTPINRLPPELLLHIIVLVRSQEPWSLAELGHVCRAWRALIKNSPAFWASVLANTWMIPENSSAPAPSASHCSPWRHNLLERYTEALQRSAPYPLSLALDTTEDRMCVVETYCKRNFLPLLMPPAISTRIASLTVVAGQFVLLDIFALLASGLPRLELLDLTCLELVNHWAHHYPQFHPFPPRDPALPSLHTLRVSGSFFLPWLCGSSLRHLSVVGNSPNTSRHGGRLSYWTALHRGLLRSPHLETLTLWHALPTTDPEDIQMSAEAWSRATPLRELRLCTVTDEPHCLEAFAYVLDCASLSAATRLDFTLAPWTHSAFRSHLTDYNSFRTSLFNIAFQRLDRDIPRIAEFSLTQDELGVFRICSTGLRCTDHFTLRTSQELASICTITWNLSPAEFLAFQLAYGRSCDLGSPRAPPLAQLVVDIHARGFMKHSQTFRLLLDVFEGIGRLEVRGGGVEALLIALGSKCGSVRVPYARVGTVDISGVYIDEEDVPGVARTISEGFKGRADIPRLASNSENLKKLSLRYSLSRAIAHGAPTVSDALSMALRNVFQDIAIEVS